MRFPLVALVPSRTSTRDRAQHRSGPVERSAQVRRPMVNARMKRLAVVPAIAIVCILLAQGRRVASQSVPDNVPQGGIYQVITLPGKNEVLLADTRTGHIFLLVGSGLDRKWMLVTKGPRTANDPATLIGDALGIIATPQFPDRYRFERQPWARGLRITWMRRDGPVSRILRPTDILLAADGLPLYERSDLGLVLRTKRPRDKIKLLVWREIPGTASTCMLPRRKRVTVEVEILAARGKKR